MGAAQRARAVGGDGNVDLVDDSSHGSPEMLPERL